MLISAVQQSDSVLYIYIYIYIYMYIPYLRVCAHMCESLSVMSDSLPPRGL